MIPGMVILWFGAIVDMPPLWQLCDGTNGSPDLRDQFVIGAGDTYDPDDTGGNVLHNHFFISDGHFHIRGPFETGMNDNTGRTDIESVLGLTDNENGLPPYHALAYLMRL